MAVQNVPSCLPIRPIPESETARLAPLHRPGCNVLPARLLRGVGRALRLFYKNCCRAVPFGWAAGPVLLPGGRLKAWLCGPQACPAGTGPTRRGIYIKWRFVTVLFCIVFCLHYLCIRYGDKSDRQENSRFAVRRSRQLGRGLRTGPNGAAPRLLLHQDRARGRVRVGLFVGRRLGDGHCRGGPIRVQARGG